MQGGNLAAAVVASLCFPGFGQGLIGRRWRMVIWAGLTIVTMLSIVVSIWGLPLTVGVRLAGAIDAYLLLKEYDVPSQRTLAATALVVGALGLGVANVSLQAFKVPSSSMYPTLVIGDHVYVDKLTVRWRPPEPGEVIVFRYPCANITYLKRVIAQGGDTVEVRCSVVYVNGTAVPSTLLEANATYKDHDEATDRWILRSSSRYGETLGDHSYDTFHDVERPGRGDARHDFPSRDKMIAPSCQSGEYYEAKPGPKQPTGKLVETKPAGAATPCEPQLHFVVPADSYFVMGDNRHNANDSRFWGVVARSRVIGRVIGVWMSSGEAGDWTRFGSVE